jgi:3',5'-cyclic-AMP phosphodiesterase
MKKKYIFWGVATLLLGIPFFAGGILIAKIKISMLSGINSSQPVQVYSAGGKNSNSEKQSVSENEAKVENAGNSEVLPDSASGNPAENQNSVFSFGIIGDTQQFDPNNANGSFQMASKKLSSENVDLVMTEGDLLSSCDGGADCEAKLNSWKNAIGALYPKTYELMGNHDRTGKDKSDALWQRFFSLPTNGPAGYSELAYSFDFKNSHFVVLNSEKPSENIVNDVQRSWLEQDLNANKKENTFVFFHEPAYPVSSKIGESLDAKPKERDALWNILSSHNVTAVFNGHEHIASRRKIGNLYQFVFGNTDSFDHDAPKTEVAEYFFVGNTYGLVKVNGKMIIIETHASDGKPLNSFDLAK